MSSRTAGLGRDDRNRDDPQPTHQRRSQISNHGRKADSCRGFGLSLLARVARSCTLTAGRLTTHKARGQEPAFSPSASLSLG